MAKTRYQKYTPDEVITLKIRNIENQEMGKIINYLKDPSESRSQYISELSTMIMSQLIVKAGLNINTYPDGVADMDHQRLTLLTERLTKHTLKRKLSLIKEKPQHLSSLSGVELLDPHHHLNSIYVKDNPHLLHLLPDFDEVYASLRGGPGIKLDYNREDELREQEGIVTDVQFLGRPPRGKLSHPVTEQPKLNETIGYVRGDNPPIMPFLKEGCITQYANKHDKVCRSCDICGTEVQDSLKDIERYIKHAFRHKAQIIRFHVGETLIPAYGKKNVEQVFQILRQKRQDNLLTNQVIRLGHGTHMGIESMHECSQHGYFVETCLSSNKETGIIAKRKEYPLGLMLLLDVKVVLGTDGGDIYYTDLKTEYAYANKIINNFLKLIADENQAILKLPNGDQLEYRHVKHLYKDIPQAQTWDDNKLMSYQDLKFIQSICKQKININSIVENMHELKSILFPGIIRPTVTTTATSTVASEIPVTTAPIIKPEITTLTDTRTTAPIAKPETPTILADVKTEVTKPETVTTTSTTMTTHALTTDIIKTNIPLIDKIDSDHDYEFDFNSFFNKSFDINNIKIIKSASVRELGHEGRLRMAEMFLHLQKLALTNPQAFNHLKLKRYRVMDIDIPSINHTVTVERDQVSRDDYNVTVNENVCRAESKILEMQFPGQVAMLNNANDHYITGNSFGGAKAQEENIARTTDLAVSLLQYSHENNGYIQGKKPCYQRNAFGQTDVLYSRNTVFRTPTFAMEEKPFSINIITSAALIMSEDKKYYRDVNGTYTLKIGRAIQAAKIYNQIAAAMAAGNKAIVLGAWGCGAFNNDAKEMAKLFRAILSLPEFIGKMKVHFAIIKGNQPNFELFFKEFNGRPLIDLSPQEAADIRAPIIAIQAFEKLTAEMTYLINSTQQKDTLLCKLRDKIRNVCVENATNVQFMSNLKNNITPILSLLCDKLQEKYIHRADMILDLTRYQVNFNDKNQMVLIISKLIHFIYDSKSFVLFTDEEIKMIENDQTVKGILNRHQLWHVNDLPRAQNEVSQAVDDDNSYIETTNNDKEKTILPDLSLIRVPLETNFFIGVWLHKEVEAKRRTKDGRDCFEIVCSTKEQFSFIKPLIECEHIKILSHGAYNKAWRIKVDPTAKARKILDIIDMMIEGNNSIATIEQGSIYLKLYHYINENKDRDENDFATTISISSSMTFNFGIPAGAKNAAAKDLAKVLFEGADPKILNNHKSALGQGELGRIYERAKKAFAHLFADTSNNLSNSKSLMNAKTN